MRLPVNALAAYLQPLPPADEIARQLTALGFEIEGREESGDGVVLEVNVTPNRGDAFSVRGLARELCAAREIPFKEIISPALPADKAESSLPITLPDPRCPRYLGVEIRGVKNGASPLSVQKRLTAFGVRPISLLVDAANWVMLELGQPLHTFDLDTLRGGLTVRAANPGETLTTLDGKARALSPWPVKGQPFVPLLICDSEEGARPVALAGVMGGGDTEISDKTLNIFLEAASFDPLATRRTARKFDLHSEASHRYERGVDPQLSLRAAARFAQLLHEWGAGGDIAGWRFAESAPPESRVVELRDAAILRLLGIELEREFTEARLAALGLVCRDSGAMASAWEIPMWRPDLAIEEDLIEELGRHYGYDRIPERLPSGIDPAPGRSELQKRLEILRQKALALGFSETVSIPFTAGQPGPDAGAAVRLANPIWLNQPELQMTLAATLLPRVIDNLQPDVLEGRAAEVRLFEIGTTFTRPAADGQPLRECAAFTLALTLPARATAHERRELLADLTHQLFGGAKVGDAEPVNLRIVSDPGLSAQLGLLSVPDVTRLEFPGLKVKPLPRFPAIIRDLNLLIALPRAGDTPPLARIHAAVARAQATHLESHHNLDRGYFGKGLPEGHFALALRFVFRKPDGTLTAEAADGAIAKIVAELAKDGMTIRGV